VRIKSTLLGPLLAIICLLALAIPASASAGAVGEPAAAVTKSVEAAAVKTTLSKSPDTPARPDAPDNCPHGATCGYLGASYFFLCGIVYGSNPDLNVPGDCWNNVDSVYNNGNYCDDFLYRYEDYNLDDGHWVDLYQYTGLANLATQAPGLYHHIWSNMWECPG
jgi:hypothetical protein